MITCHPLIARWRPTSHSASRIAAGVGELIQELMPPEIALPAEEINMCQIEKPQDASGGGSERREGRSRSRSGPHSRSRSPSVPIATLIDEEFLDGSDYKVCHPLRALHTSHALIEEAPSKGATSKCNGCNTYNVCNVEVPL